MYKLFAGIAAVGALAVSGPTIALAANPHTSAPTGQPSQSCQSTPPFPGNTGTSPGSAFNGSAGNVYANPDTQGGTSSGNTQVASQYDVACFQQSMRP